MEEFLKRSKGTTLTALFVDDDKLKIIRNH